MNVSKFIFILLLHGSLYAQTFTNTVTIQKDLRVQGETVLGGVSKLEDITMYADTIHIGNLDGTGTLLGISGTGKVTRVTGAGAGGVTGLTPNLILFGKSDGTIEQNTSLKFTPTGAGQFYVGSPSYFEGADLTIGALAGNETVFDGVGRITKINGLSINTGDILKGTAGNVVDALVMGGASQLLRVNAGGTDIEWWTPTFGTGTVTSIATTSPITGGTITTTGTIGIGGLSSLGTAGSLIRTNSAATAWEYLSAGSENQILTMESGLPTWVNVPILGDIIYYWTPTASDVATYKKQTITPYTPLTTLSTAGVTTGQLLYTMITEPSTPNATFIPSGEYSAHIHAAKTAGTKDAYIYVEFWETNSAGVDIALINTTLNTTILTGVSAEYTVSITTPLYNLTSTSSRIATKIYATISGGGSAPTVEIYVGGAADSRINLPKSAENAVTSFTFTDGSGFDGTVTNSTTTPTLALTTNVTDNQIFYSDNGALKGFADFTYDDATELLDVNKFHINGAAGTISLYQGTTASDGELLIGNAGTGEWERGYITSTDLTVTNGSATISLDYASGSIVSGDLAGSIDATKIADGSVTSTEFQYINTVTSNVQTQLDNKGYVITLTGTQNTVADATSYYTGAIPAGTGTTADINRVYLPMGGTITACYVSFYNSGTLASGESSTFAIRYDNTTDVTVSTGVLNNATQTVASNTGLSQAVTQGHYIEGKFTTATWATNPTNIRWTVTIFIKS